MVEKNTSITEQESFCLTIAICQLNKTTSIHDIARHLKVSATTVSFVLNGKGAERKISTAMEKKILTYVAKIGYKPNHLAKSLRTGKTKIIGMLVEDIADPFFSAISRGIEEKLYGLGYKIFHCSSNNDTERSKKILNTFRQQQVDGYILVPAPGIENEIQSLINDDKPVILLDRYFPKLITVNIVVDNSGGAYQAVTHLIENGYRQIAFVTLKSDQPQMKQRLHGYSKAIEENKLEKCVKKIPYRTPDDRITAIVKSLLKEHAEIDAIFFSTNYLAVAGLKAIRETGLQIPGEIGIVGFDDNTHFSLFSPSITAVAQPIDEMTEEAVQYLIKALDDKADVAKPDTIVLPVNLIIRNSSINKIKKSIIH